MSEAQRRSDEGVVQLRLAWHRFADFSAAQLYEVLRFRQAVFVVEQACAYPDLDDLDQRAQHLLLRQGSVLAGYLRLIPYPNERRVAIGRLAVAAASRRQRLARRLIEEALARCRLDYADLAVTLSAQTHLTPFYRGIGFRPTSPPYDDYGIEHIDMMTNLS